MCWWASHAICMQVSTNALLARPGVTLTRLKVFIHLLAWHEAEKMGVEAAELSTNRAGRPLVHAAAKHGRVMSSCPILLMSRLV